MLKCIIPPRCNQLENMDGVGKTSWNQISYSYSSSCKRSTFYNISPAAMILTRYHYFYSVVIYHVLVIYENFCKIFIKIYLIHCALKCSSFRSKFSVPKSYSKEHNGVYRRFKTIFVMYQTRVLFEGIESERETMVHFCTQ